MHVFIENFIHLCHSQQISQTLYLKHIHSSTLNASQTLSLFPTQSRWTNCSLIQSLPWITLRSFIVQHKFQCSSCLILLIPFTYGRIFHIPFAQEPLLMDRQNKLRCLMIHMRVLHSGCYLLQALRNLCHLLVLQHLYHL